MDHIGRNTNRFGKHTNSVDRVPRFTIGDWLLVGSSIAGIEKLTHAILHSSAGTTAKEMDLMRTHELEQRLHIRTCGHTSAWDARKRLTDERVEMWLEDIERAANPLVVRRFVSPQATAVAVGHQPAGARK